MELDGSIGQQLRATVTPLRLAKPKYTPSMAALQVQWQQERTKAALAEVEAGLATAKAMTQTGQRA
eukprot:3933343-Amphidinium_carterae.1